MSAAPLRPATVQPASPLADPQRLAALAATGLAAGAAVPLLDELARVATLLLGAPAALVSLVDDRRQWFAGLAGLGGAVAESRQTPLARSYCRHVVATGAPLVVDDVAADPLVRDTGPVGDLPVGAYLGVPLATAGGHTLGALCAMHRAPHRWTADEVERLRGLALAAAAELERRLVTHALRRSDSQVEVALGSVGVLVWSWDLATDLVRRRGALLAQLGYDPADVPDEGAHAAWWMARLHPDDRAAADAHAAALRDGAERALATEYRFRRADGSYATLAARVRRLDERGDGLDEADGTPLRCVVGVVLDVSARAEAVRAQRESEERLRLALDASRMVAWEIDLRGRHPDAPPDALPPPETAIVAAGAIELPVDSVGALLRGVHPEDRAGMEAAIARVLRAEEGASHEFRIVLPDGAVRWRRVAGRVLQDAAGRPECVVGVSADITEHKQLEARLTEQAHRDTLTGLANRTLFGQRVTQAIARGVAAESAPAVLLVDLDDFKRVNDGLGHAAGDELLTATAVRLLDATRGSDTVARLGGDEFAILLGGVRDAAEAERVADRVVAALAAPVVAGGSEIRVSASVGIAVAAPGDGADALLRNADLALYGAKGAGRGRHATFQPAMHAQAVERLALEAELRQAIEHEELTLHFQPLVALDTGHVTGAEALVRWAHPTRGLVPPAAFIPLAERTELVVPLGRWVLRAACRAAAGWAPAADGAPLGISVNVSGRQLQRAGFVQDVAEALRDAGLAPHRLVLEVTESVLLAEHDAALGRLEALRALGVRVALDDFGTGYSSLAYLQRLPVDELKIDRSFMVGVEDGGRRAAVVQAVVTLAATLDLRTVAEGIETVAQRDALAALGCDLGQGYLFARPLPADEFAALVGRAPAGAVGAAAAAAPPAVAWPPPRLVRDAPPAAPAAPARPTVLVVDDDAQLRRLIRRMLERAGFAVLEAGDGVDALRQLGQLGGGVDLVLSDVRMPELSGRSLADALAASAPALRVLLISGWHPGELEDEADAGAPPLLRKPFTADALLAAIGALLPEAA